MDLLFVISIGVLELDVNMVYIKEVINKIIDKYGVKNFKYSLLIFG